MPILHPDSAAMACLCWLAVAAGIVVATPSTTEQLGVITDAPGLQPRFYMTAIPAAPVAKRQEGCGLSSHPCRDIGASNCCPDGHYCFSDLAARAVQCCPLNGASCQKLCPSTQYECLQTTTITASPTSSVSTYSACCDRPCSLSSFLCAAEFGGGCCPNGQTCASNKECRSVIRPTSSPPSAIVSMVPEGCTAGQITCASSLGGGCCNHGFSCIQLTGNKYCSSVLVKPTGEGEVAVPQDAGLSSAAKAGIGAGVAVGASVVIGVLTWICVRRRRQARSQSGRQGRGGVAASGTAASGVPMSEDNSDHLSRGGPLPGLAQDYFGPDADHGPYTVVDHPTSAATSPGQGVPRAPRGPNDIVAPVEIDGTDRDDNSQPPSVGWPSPPPQDSIQGRFELYGSHEPETRPSHTSPSPGYYPDSARVSPANTPPPHDTRYGHM